MNSLLKWGLVLIAAVAVIVVLRFTLLAPDPLLVEVYPVDRGPVEETVSNTRAGTVRVPRRATVSVDTPGRILSIESREGDRFYKDDLLIRVDDREPVAALERARREADSAVADETAIGIRCGLLRREADRLDSLHEEGVVSEERADNARSVARQCDAELVAAGERIELARASVEQARVALERTRVGAPFDGVVNRVMGEEGEYILPGAPVLDVMELGSMYVRAEIDEVDLARVREGLPVRVTLDPFRGRTFDGRVRRVAPFVSELEQQNRTLEVDVDFTNPDHLSGVKPGTSADVEIILQTRPGVLRVPSYSLLKGNRLLVVEDDTARERQVEVGLRNWDFAEISSGISVGDLVIVSLDREGVQDGVPVEIEE